MRLPNARYLLTLGLLTVAALAAAASPTIKPVVVLPDGSRCVATADQDRLEVFGGRVDYLCGDEGGAGLVDGLLFSGPVVVVEYVTFTPGSSTPSGGALEVHDQQLMSFVPRRIELEDGSRCHALNEPLTLLGAYQASYRCDDQGELRNRYLIGDLSAASGEVVARQLRLNDALSEELSMVNANVTVIDAALPLTETLWRLESFGTGFDAPIEGAEPTLQFLPGRIAGDAGCNRYFAAATLRGEGDLVLGPAGSTLMACEEGRMEQEQRFLKALDGVAYYEVIDGKLYLYGSGETLKFASAGPAEVK